MSSFEVAGVLTFWVKNDIIHPDLRHCVRCAKEINAKSYFNHTHVRKVVVMISSSLKTLTSYLMTSCRIFQELVWENQQFRENNFWLNPKRFLDLAFSMVGQVSYHSPVLGVCRNRRLPQLLRFNLNQAKGGGDLNLFMTQISTWWGYIAPGLHPKKKHVEVGILVQRNLNVSRTLLWRHNVFSYASHVDG